MQGIKQRCDFCKEVAVYDALTKVGVHAYVCQLHFDRYAIGEEDSFTTIEQRTELPFKECSRCGLLKPSEEFYEFRDSGGRTRRRAECKTCNQMDRKLNSLHKNRGKK